METQETKKASLRAEVRERTIGYIVAAFGLIAGLAWNDAVKSLIEEFVPKPGNGIIIKFMYAFVITIVLVVISIYLLRLAKPKSNN